MQISETRLDYTEYCSIIAFKGFNIGLGGKNKINSEELRCEKQLGNRTASKRTRKRRSRKGARTGNSQIDPGNELDKQDRSKPELSVPQKKVGALKFPPPKKIHACASGLNLQRCGRTLLLADNRRPDRMADNCGILGKFPNPQFPELGHFFQTPPRLVGIWTLCGKSWILQRATF